MLHFVYELKIEKRSELNPRFLEMIHVFSAPGRAQIIEKLLDNPTLSSPQVQRTTNISPSSYSKFILELKNAGFVVSNSTENDSATETARIVRDDLIKLYDSLREVLIQKTINDLACITDLSPEKVAAVKNILLRSKELDT